MAQILYSPPSPYSAKVRMAAHYAGIQADSVVVTTAADPEELINANPLGKIPTFIADDGKAIFDSRAITQYLNRVSGHKLFPRNAENAQMLSAMKRSLTVFVMYCWFICMNAACVLKRKFTSPG